MSTLNYDVVVLGGGTGGYVAAIKAAQLGKTVAIVEREKLGGTCLHKGCIPSKSFLRSAEVYATMNNSEEYGVTASSIQLHFEKVQNRKNKIVDQLHKGIEFLMKKNKIDVFYGNGRVIGPSIFSPRSGAIAIESEIEENNKTLVPKNLIIATGSRPRVLPNLEVDGKFILTSDEALELDELPKSIIIVGGGVIGVEWASLFSDFGVEVTIVETEKNLIPTEDIQISKELERIFKKRKIKILKNAMLLTDSIETEDGMVTMKVKQKDSELDLKAEKMLLSVGRQANVENLGLENTDIKVENGFIKVNTYLQTNESHIYAIGDVIGGLQLAHVASHEGILAVEHAAGHEVHPMLFQNIPRCVYTRPEIASVGWTEQQAKEKGFDVKTASISFKAIGKALVYGSNDGFVKVIADRESNDILGVHMIGPHVTDYISEAGLALVLDATPWEVGQTIHAHPTLSEALGEAMLGVDGNAIGI
ncbi:dihydrolipoyl dehydrogenase [Chengkuizengella marina]|uniref:Dihydrolipoyl dehydrogenase n=1 Tax=Chengkuizengella marina TaxID=2507566 RepID=A0A6N9PYY6_9BACL|nr:dihydrolipoyl dehydrogenase [Chengkuizengella marina]NBI27633.1 dihydrolipoyl dehydrogenase [Chengkuizengella marina]